MSIYVMSTVWERSHHSGSALLILLAIADFARDDGSAWPSIETLAKKTRLSERQTIRIIKKLEESGELNVKHRRNVGNHYIIMLESLSDKMSLIESVRDVSYDTESQLISDSAESPITDSIESHDPSLTVIKTQAKGALVDSQEPVDATRESIRIADDEVTEGNVEEYFKQKKNDRQKTGVRSPDAEELPSPPRTEKDIEDGVRRVVLENAVRNEEENRDPVVESYLATVPEHVRELARVFCEHKKRPPLKKENAMWRREWQDQFDIGISPDNVRKAIKYMGMNNLGVRSPMSTITIAENIRLGHIVVDEDRQVKSSEVSYDLPSGGAVEVADEEELSPMEELLSDD